jgi:hypothetical protein
MKKETCIRRIQSRKQCACSFYLDRVITPSWLSMFGDKKQHEETEAANAT